MLLSVPLRLCGEIILLEALRDSEAMNHKGTKTPRDLKADNPSCLGVLVVRVFFLALLSAFAPFHGRSVWSDGNDFALPLRECAGITEHLTGTLVGGSISGVSRSVMFRLELVPFVPVPSFQGFKTRSPRGSLTDLGSA